MSERSAQPVEAAPLREAWRLDPDVVHLNHGSYGACPSAVLDEQDRFRGLLESQPGAFYSEIAPRALAHARERLGAFIGARGEDLAFVTNVTTAINSVLGSIDFRPGDEVLVTDHEYNATRNAAEHHAVRAGALSRTVKLPFRGVTEDAVVERVVDAVGPRTRLVILDHVTSQTALIMPIARVIAELSDRGIDVLIDGAHAPGMIDLDVSALGAAYYTGNCHKWICAPKSAGFLWAREDLRDQTRPAIVSHGANAPGPLTERFRHEFDWQGTTDPSAALCVPAALDVMSGLWPTGWPGIEARNHQLAVRGREILCSALDIAPPCADALLGSMATIPLPPWPSLASTGARSALDRDPLRAMLLKRFKIEVPVFECDPHPGRVMRISAQLYNTESDYERLASALLESRAS